MQRYINAVDRVQTRLTSEPPFIPPQCRTFTTHPRITSPPYKRGTKFPVVVTTDDTSLQFLTELENLGWKVVNHEKLNTLVRDGPWAAAIIDAGILSRANGFVGTMYSTYSTVAAKRVKVSIFFNVKDVVVTCLQKYWQGGPTEVA